MGIMFALIALGCWGVGDFLIQRSTRAFGDWTALFFICAVGTILLAPFSVYEIFTSPLSEIGLALLFGSAVFMLLASLFQLEALKRGKISIIEPILTLEILSAVLAGSMFLNEHLTRNQLIFIALIIVGIFLASVRSFSHFKSAHLEKGIWFALLGGLIMGGTDTLFGAGAREVSPFLVAWFTTTFMAIITFLYLWHKKRLGEIVQGWKTHKKLICLVGFFDNTAWVAYPASMLFIPVGIATSISESYIVINIILGLKLNKERVSPHQYPGLALTVVGVILLSLTL
ncbi:MAG: Membrane protein [Parcubacteria group bacterium GW2011_GWA2_56_7]|nr:MAG: Membrane protein [Parcubacteria group bacterium GW2011_GWA2_56_7]